MKSEKHEGQEMKLYALVLEYGDYDEFVQGVYTARKVAITETDDVDFNTDKVWRERYGE